MEIEKSLSTSNPTPLNSWGRSLSYPQSSLIDLCNTFRPFRCNTSPDRNPTPLVRGNNQPAHLISTMKRHRAHQLETIACLFSFSMRVCLRLTLLTVISIHGVCHTYMREGFNTKVL
ncbi:hypothetical protein TNCV_1594101 [Trichonephila clavipes]|nr:hypothetical protein TNCV_1594101 [Trichonephila clavipes]